MQFCLALAMLTSPSASSAHSDSLARQFQNPPNESRPWVYWYFMDGHLTEEGMKADLAAMKKAGIGGALFLEVGLGMPKGRIEFMSDPWQDLLRKAMKESHRLGLEMGIGSGPGWCGTGGPWITPELSMQHLVASETMIEGPMQVSVKLPRPNPRTPYFGEESLTPELKKLWQGFYKDVIVLAFPTPQPRAKLEDVDEKALYFRPPYSSTPGVKPFLTSQRRQAEPSSEKVIPQASVIDLTDKMAADGTLNWQAPAGKWTVLRFGRTITGQTTRPAPDPGLGLESDKFDKASLDAHASSYLDRLLKGAESALGKGRGLTALHFDSWEMSSQNWSAEFRNEFGKRRGYDPAKMLPVMLGHLVGSLDQSERFLWDLRLTAQELVIENHATHLKAQGRRHGLKLTIEPYDLNPTTDLELGGVADVPGCEFWSKGFGFDTNYSVFEAASIAHMTGKKRVWGEAFTANPGEDWQQHPGSMKEQTDWALAAGVNRFAFHRFQAQPKLDEFPGMTMAAYGVFWDRTQTWWDMVGAYHQYLSRCQHLLSRGAAVIDLLYLVPEGAPNVFLPPSSALDGDLPDKKGHSFAGIAPSVLMTRAKVRDGRIELKDGPAATLLALPRFDSMTPELLRHIKSLVEQGAKIIGRPPVKSPSLVNYPASDREVQALAGDLWGIEPSPKPRRVGKGLVYWDLFDLEGEQEHPLAQAQWIWASQGNPAEKAPVGTEAFRRTIEVREGKPLASAKAVLTADNSFVLSVNGASVGKGSDFHKAVEFEFTPLMKKGVNEIVVRAVNEGTDPNPAGWIGVFVLTYSDGSQETIRTDGSWEVLGSGQAMALGPVGMAPWNLNTKGRPEIYPDFKTTSEILVGMGVLPSFTSDGELRFAHRIDGRTEIFFVSNKLAARQEVAATFRTAGMQPEWWDPQTGETRDLPEFLLQEGRTILPLTLEPYESGFVLFRRKGSPSLSEAANFSPIRPVQTIKGPWQVSFDPKWGGPSAAAFEELTDWAKNPDPRINGYSGKAVYRTTFDSRPSSGDLFLSLGKVKNLASVRLNGKDLGVAWCDPWRVKIPAGLVRAKNNRLEITVANLWINRLIADKGLPDSQRLTKTTYNPYKPDSPKAESGLLGPVVLEAAG